MAETETENTLLNPQALESRTPLFPHLVPPAIMVWIFVWKYILEPFIYILQHLVLQLSRSTNFCFWVQLPFYLKKTHTRMINGSKIYFQTKIHTIIAGGTK